MPSDPETRYLAALWRCTPEEVPERLKAVWLVTFGVEYPQLPPSKE